MNDDQNELNPPKLAPKKVPPAVVPKRNGAPHGIQEYRRIILTSVLGLLLIAIPIEFQPSVALSDTDFAKAHPTARLWSLECLELATKIGDAFLIAAIIGFGVDIAIKRSLVEEVVRAASPELLGRHLPRPVQGALLSMFDVTLIRPEWLVEYTLTPVEGEPAVIKVESAISGLILNCGRSEEVFGFLANVDPSRYGHESKITRISISPEFGVSIVDERPDNATLLQADGTKLIRHPFSIGSGEKFRTKVELEEYHPSSFILPLFTGTTVAKTVLKITYPQDLLDIQVSTGSSESLLPKATTAFGREWEILTPILPGQCVLTAWLPKPAPAERLASSKVNV